MVFITIYNSCTH